MLLRLFACAAPTRGARSSLRIRRKGVDESFGRFAKPVWLGRLSALRLEVDGFPLVHFPTSEHRGYHRPALTELRHDGGSNVYRDQRDQQVEVVLVDADDRRAERAHLGVSVGIDRLRSVGTHQGRIMSLG